VEGIEVLVNRLMSGRRPDMQRLESIRDSILDGDACGLDVTHMVSSIFRRGFVIFEELRRSALSSIG